ncbi:PH domain-containing protein [Georgenia sp. H159]|uniref:PH domain-containing protein n=1 Tax=Georgenia sp. H159 TaxID=3076115 RepID=UPI002D76A2CB|nr:PH domain-containing protein [Georgenia sp. H159]
MEPAIVFRAPTSRVYAVATWVVAAVVLGAFVANGGPNEVLAYGALPVLLAVLGWTAFWRPHVRVERAGVRVVNVLSTTWAPWAAVTGTRTRWGLELLTHSGTVGAWGLPARSAIGRWVRTTRDEPVVTSLRRLDSDVAGGGEPGTAAELIEEHRTGHLQAGSTGVDRRLDMLPAGLLLVVTGLAMVTLLL